MKWLKEAESRNKILATQQKAYDVKKIDRLIDMRAKDKTLSISIEKPLLLVGKKVMLRALNDVRTCLMQNEWEFKFITGKYGFYWYCMLDLSIY